MFQKDKIMLKYPLNRTAFIIGSSNLKRLALNSHQISRCHDTGVQETAHERAVDGDNSILHEIPTKNR